MQVARAGRTRNSPQNGAPVSRLGAGGPDLHAYQDLSGSYAPLYLSSTLGGSAFDIEQLHDLTLQRLRLLKAIDSIRNAHKTAVNPVTISEAVSRAERDNNCNVPPSGTARRDAILHDQAAHFLLRLAASADSDMSAWFLSRECDLFRSRLDGAGTAFALEILRTADGPDITPVTGVALDGLRADLDAVARGTSQHYNDGGAGAAVPYYSVSFEHVPALVRSRRVLVRAGRAYVPERHVKDVVAAQFRARMARSLAVARKGSGIAEQDARVGAIVGAARARFAADAEDEAERSGFGASHSGEGIRLRELQTALPAMPLCMANMMGRLRVDHHLRYGARLQLGLFLKGCGLTMDESLKFWRAEFGKGTITPEKFDKEYAYNIRHHYGKEGKRRDLAPFPCMRIINDRPGPSEHHGCPYREKGDRPLRDMLQRAGAPPAAVPGILSAAKDGNFQGACGMCFVATQPGPHAIGDAGTPLFYPTHPNGYFLEARQKISQAASRNRMAPARMEVHGMEEDMPPVQSQELEASQETLQKASRQSGTDCDVAGDAPGDAPTRGTDKTSNRAVKRTKLCHDDDRGE